jgi:predicted nucleotidyltransferase
VFGYSHPPSAYICDVEYAPETIFKSTDPRAFRNRGQEVFYKFYADEGWIFIQSKAPQYVIPHEMLGRKVVGVNYDNILEIRKPDVEFRKLVNNETGDGLVGAMRDVQKVIRQASGVSIEDFGVFGSLLHGFHNPMFSDIDLTIHGRTNIEKLRDTLRELYKTDSSQFRSEFETTQSIKKENWRFKNLSPEEYVWHQRRKLIYALFEDEKTGRTIKTEFEPVKDWEEISSEYDSETKISPRGWSRMLACIKEDFDAPFIPSVYAIEPLKVLEGMREAQEVSRIVSYMEEFRIQAFQDEVVYVEGNLEEVTTSKGSFHQIALTYCPRYYEQVLKTAPDNKVL